MVMQNSSQEPVKHAEIKHELLTNVLRTSMQESGSTLETKVIVKSEKYTNDSVGKGSAINLNNLSSISGSLWK